MSGLGAVLAAWLRQDEEGPWQGVTSTCRRCERPSMDLEDGECRGCRGDAEAEYMAQRERRARANREQFLATADYMRRAGYPDEAAYWEHRGGR